jgi:hypothetical protein
MSVRVSLIGALAITVAGSAHAAPLMDQRLICEHLRVAIPTPAPLKVALINVDNVLFTCPGNEALRPPTYLMSDVDELAAWRDGRPIDREDTSEGANSEGSNGDL